MIRNVLLLFLSAGISCNSLLPANNDIALEIRYKFRHLTDVKGLSNNRINSICQDNYGYIWIATVYGLNKYNGIWVNDYYQSNRDEFSLPSNFIRSVFSDSYGNLWIGTDQGICIYDEGRDGFRMFTHKDMPNNLSNIYDILEDKNGWVWFATDLGLLKYNPAIDSLLVYDTRRIKIPSLKIMRIYEDLNNKLWFSCYNCGLCYFDIENESLQCFKNNPEDESSISDNSIETIYRDSRGNLWIGTYNNGLNRFNPEASNFTRIIVDKTNNYSNRVRAVFEDITGNLFVGTRAGIYLYKNKENKFIPYANTSESLSRLSANSVICVYQDRTNGLWIGTHHGGVNYASMESKPFITYSAKEKGPHFLNSPTIFGIDEDSYGNLYIGTDKGVNILNSASSTFHYLVHDPAIKNSLSYNDVKSIAVEQNGNFWAATNKGGLNYYNKKAKSFRVFRNIPGDSTSLPNDKVYYIYLDKDENLWVMTNHDRDYNPSKLSLLKKGSTNFINYDYDCYHGVVEGKDGRIYFGGINGIWEYKASSDKFTYYGDSTIVKGGVLAIQIDDKDIIWIGTFDGLVRFDKFNNKFTKYNYKNGYPLPNVFGVQADNSGNLWVSTNAGLIKMINAQNQIDTIRFRMYGYADGLPSKEFNYNSSFKNKKGELFFGGNNGLVRFQPDKIRDSRFKPQVVISELLVDGKRVFQGEQIENKILLQQPISKTKALTINHKVKTITIKFDALHYVNPEHNTYRYMLENFDNNWNYSGAFNNYVSYSNLNPGDYKFRLYAANSDGAYNDTPVELFIEVKPPYWKTWIFRISLFFLLIGLGCIILKSRVKRLERQKKFLKKAVEKRTAELNKSNEKLKEQKYEILAQNEEIQSQNEELLTQRELIERNNLKLKAANEHLHLLNDFGKQLTSKLSIYEIQKIIIQCTSTLIKVDIIGFGLYNKKEDALIFSNFTEHGETIPKFKNTLDDPTSLAAYCFKSKKTVVCNDFKQEYKSFVTELKIRSQQIPDSVAYFPIYIGAKPVGILTLQSYTKHVFTETNVNLIKSMLTYISIALDNAFAYEIVQKQKAEIEKHQNFLEQLVEERTHKLEIAKNKAVESDNLKSAFLANMSHEIRTPLNAIIGMVDLLSEEDVTEEQAEMYRQIIKNSGYTLLKLINDLIDFSKIEADQIEISKAPIDLNNFLLELQNTFDEELKQNPEKRDKISLKLRFHKNKKFTIESDAIRLHQIFNNLINNAIKFTKEGTIEFGVKQVIEGKRIELFVKDTGIGISKKHHDLIFERFSKINEDKSTLYRGAGLGLAITKSLIEKLEGKIHLESEINKGTEFTIYLPYHTSSKTDKKPKESVIQKYMDKYPNWENKVFLVAEDDETNSLLIESILVKTKAKVIRVHDGEMAVDEYMKSGSKIDLVLLDIKMPKKDGFETINDIRAINPNAKVIAQTAFAMADEERKIRKSGFDDYIAKPITRGKLLYTVAKHLD